MAKPIPKKKAVVKKKRREEIQDLFDPKAQKKLERKISNLLMEMDEKAEERWKWVDAITTGNDVSLTDALDLMVEQLKKMQGPPKLYLDGRVVNISEPEFHMLQEIQEKNFYWIALRCVVACAEWGIRIADFKAPKKACLRCGKAVKK